MTKPEVIGEPRRLSEESRAMALAQVAQGHWFNVGGALYARYGSAFAVPLSFTYEGEGPCAWEMTVQLGPDGVARCVRLVLDSPPGGKLTTTLLRQVPLPELVEEALLMTAIPLSDMGVPEGNSIGQRVESLKEARRLYDALLREHRRRTRRPKRSGARANRIPVEDVARVYREAISVGSPTQAVADYFQIPRSSAGRWVAVARQRGALNSAPAAGVLGEAIGGATASNAGKRRKASG